MGKVNMDHESTAKTTHQSVEETRKSVCVELLLSIEILYNCMELCHANWNSYTCFFTPQFYSVCERHEGKYYSNIINKWQVMEVFLDLHRTS